MGNAIMRAFRTSFPAFGTVESNMAANVEFQDLAASFKPCVRHLECFERDKKRYQGQKNDIRGRKRYQGHIVFMSSCYQPDICTSM